MVSLRKRGYLSEGSCPIRGGHYGGIPGGGGYRPYKEYDVGAQRMAEAAHCILGSIAKILPHYDQYKRGEDTREGYEGWKVGEKPEQKPVEK